jgi:hypothetical protein
VVEHLETFTRPWVWSSTPPIMLALMRLRQEDLEFKSA